MKNRAREYSDARVQYLALSNQEYTMMARPDSMAQRNENIRQEPSSPQSLLWPILIELWLSSILIGFFVVRILGSQTAHRILGHFGYRPLR